ncbi:MAG: Na+/proline symporter [Acidimicrobiaceae bacterium]|nr:MAG: Na+/proline symporter [Acidimicrobiaceae bacterium]
MHLELGDDRCVFRRHTCFRLALDREVGGERVLRDHHGRGVDAVAALQALESLGHIDHALHVGVGGVHRSQLAGRLVTIEVLGVLLEAVLERRVAPHHERRHRLGDLVADAVRKPEHARRVAHRVAGFDRAEGDDLGHVVAAVALGRVADHLVAVSRVEVHVDVGHLDPTRVEEALEEQVVADRVEVGDAQAVGNGAARCRTTTGPDPDARVLGVLDEVPDDEEVAREPHVLDRQQLVGEAFDDGGGQGVAPPLPGALPGEVIEVGSIVGEALGDLEVRELRFAELDGNVGALGHPECVVAGLRVIAEKMAHLGGGLEVVLGAFELEALRIAQQRAGLHAQQGVVSLVVVLMGVVRVVGGDQRGADPAGDLDQLGVGLALRRETVVLQLDEQVVLAEDVLQPTRLGEGAPVVTVQKRLQHVTTEASGGGDDSLVVPLEQFPVDLRLVVVALEEGQAGELDEVPVTLIGLGQQGEVVVELPATLGVAARIVETTTSRRPLGAGLEGCRTRAPRTCCRDR